MITGARGQLLVGAAAAAAVLLLAAPGSAHQRQLVRIGETDYLFIVGFLNEPVFTGDRSGVELQVLRADPSEPLDSRAPGAAPVRGLDRTLKVEVKAGGRAKVLELRPAHRLPGRYEAVFYPTAAATYSYRFFGAVEGVPVDLTFTCGSRVETPVDEQRPVELAPGVVQKVVLGGFGCPADRREVEFPGASSR